MIVINLLFIMTMIILGQANIVPESEYRESLRSKGGGWGNLFGHGTKAEINTEGKPSAAENAYNLLIDGGRLNNPKTQKPYSESVVPETGIEYSENSQLDGETKANSALSENGGHKFKKGSHHPSLVQKNTMNPIARPAKHRGTHSLYPSTYFKNVQNTNPKKLHPTSHPHHGRNTVGYYYGPGNIGALGHKNVLQKGTLLYAAYGPPNEQSPFHVASINQQGPQTLHYGTFGQIPVDLDEPNQIDLYDHLENRIIKLEDAIKRGYKFDPIEFRGITYALLLPSKLTIIHNNYLNKMHNYKKMIKDNSKKLLDLVTLDEESQPDIEPQVNTAIQANNQNQAETDTLEQLKGIADALVVTDAVVKDDGGDNSSEAPAHETAQAGSDSYNGVESQANGITQASGDETLISSTTQADLQLQANDINRPKQIVEVTETRFGQQQPQLYRLQQEHLQHIVRQPHMRWQRG